MRPTLLMLAAALAAAPAICQDAGYDPGDLSDRLSRTVSLTGTFFGRFDALVAAHTRGAAYRDGYASLNGVWYNGYSIQTDYGLQTGVLGRVYGDIMYPIAGDNLALVAGIGGYRYGVFLSDIPMPLPAADPMGESSLTVTDFTGTQYFQDIYAAALAVRRVGALTAFYAATSLYAPRSGVLDFQSPISTTGYFGARGEALGILRGEALFSVDAAFQRAGGTIDPVGLVDLALGTELGRALLARAGVLWRTFKSTGFDWSRFVAPASLGVSPWNALTFEAGAVLYSPRLREEFGGWLRSAYGGARLRLGSLASVGAAASWHTDPRLASFSGGRESVIGYSANLSLHAGGLVLRAGARKDYYSDLDDLIEACGKPVLFLDILWKAYL